jgi:hypothetical protein
VVDTLGETVAVLVPDTSLENVEHDLEADVNVGASVRVPEPQPRRVPRRVSLLPAAVGQQPALNIIHVLVTPADGRLIVPSTKSEGGS